ncbi:Uncharacterised protein [Burkholderia pseudomallei]|uniref:hypothetical protein n=1 Tax=Burkholderia pseudomallei TaxID=28450 RepID=UPI0001722B54|nr:hypothetical protein [Burkholderia pseudomallei]EDS86589.1 hypothetical protein BURPSS13_G0070 [Burkholderia pseudomallei S13]MBF3439900.1 hypothetical protein [Burkholderia pseudomallei]MBF3464413.1 hypothetical protein [Burkholderia pseudomallei]CAJ3829692.1 Uncharacterised protein [Burkholderia pseudomallei]CAJ4741039.1 Uncharacterised protein [Burkholderia pseudomallei]
MAGRPPEVDHVKRDFVKEIDSAKSLVSTVRALPAKVRPSNAIGIHPKYVQQVVELAFMGVVSAWEEFVERSLVRYVAGAQTSAGYTPTPKFGQANNIQHSYELLSQDTNYDPLKHYLKVSDPRWVRRTADFFFSAHPYTCLQNHGDLLKHASCIRNRTAHSSEKCRADFKTTAVHFLQPANGVLSQGFGPGALLLQPVQRHFGQPAIQAGLSHFDAYMDTFGSLANQVVP